MPPEDQVAAVVAAYDRIAARWSEARGEMTGILPRLLDRAIGDLRPGARVLDVGCGSGIPVARSLLGRGFEVTGLDASARLIEIARTGLPGARFVLGDMRSADPGSGFDAAVAWDSLFHLPRPDQTAMLGRLRGWLRPGGRLLASFGGSAGDITGVMLGETFRYSAHDPADTLALLRAAGFEVLHEEWDEPDPPGHFAVVARRRE